MAVQAVKLNKLRQKLRVHKIFTLKEVDATCKYKMWK